MANQPASVPVHRSLPAGGGQRLRRAYLLQAATMIVLAAGAAGMLALAGSTVSRGQRSALPALPAAAEAILALLLATFAALVARTAVHGDTVALPALRSGNRAALVAQVVAVTGGMAAVGFGAVLAFDGPASGLWIAVGVGAPVAGLAILAGSVRRLISRTAGSTT